MRLRKRYIAALLGVAFLLFWSIRFSLEWHREFVSAIDSLDNARAALAEGDTKQAIDALSEAVERSAQDSEELSAIISQELAVLDGTRPLPLADAARLYRYRLHLQAENCATQSWQKVLTRRIEALGLSSAEASLRFNMLHPGRELLEACVAQGDTVDTFAAWQQGRIVGQQLKDVGSMPEWAHVLRALANLKTRELDAMELSDIPAAPIMGWLRKAESGRSGDAQLLRALTVGLAIAKEDDLLSDRPLPRKDSLAEAVALADQFVADHPDSIAGQVTRIETRVRAAEMAAMSFEVPAQQLLNSFAERCPPEANRRDVLRTADLQIRNLRFLDPGSPDGAQAIANVRRLAGSLLDRHPDAPDALLVLGRLYRRLGQDESARQYLGQAANSAIEVPPCLLALTWDLSAGLAALELADMDLSAAETAGQAAPADLDRLDHSVDLVADRIGDRLGDVLLTRGRSALLRGRRREGIRHLEEACKQVGKARPEAYFYSGMALAQAGETGIAAKRLDLYLLLADTLPEHRLQAARALAGTALVNLPPDQAARRIAELGVHYPDDVPLALARAQAVLHAILQTNSDQASRTASLETVRAILLRQLATGEEGALFLMAQAEALLGEGSETMQSLENFCHNHPQQVDSLIAWCRALRLRGNVDREEQEVRTLALPYAAPPVAALLERALAREPGPRNQLYPLLRLAFITDPAELQLGLFWVQWGLGDTDACADALAAGLAARPDHEGLLGAQLALLLDTGQTAAARTALAHLPTAIPAWQRQLWEAKLLIAVHDQPGAERVLRGLLAHNPHLTEAMALQGDLALDRGQVADAMLRYRECLADNPLQPIALEGIADICIARKESVPVFECLRRLVRLSSPSQPRLESLLLEQLAEDGTTATAVRLREHRQQQAPWDRHNRQELARLQQRSRHGGRAAEILRSLLQEEPSDLAILAQLARTLADDGYQREARELLLSANADVASVRDGRACLDVIELLIAYGADDEARSLLEKTIANEDSMADPARFQLANMLYDQGQWSSAGAIYAACSGADNRPDLLRRRAECAIRSGALPAARPLLDTLQRRAPDDPLVQVLTAELALRSGDEAWATAACERALALDPGCATAFLVRARLRLRGGSSEEILAAAVNDLEKACIRDPKLTAARELLARLQLERGKTDEAEASLRLLVGACPSDHRLKVALARLLLEVQRHATLASLVKNWREELPEEAFWWQIEGMLATAQGNTRDAADAFAQHAQRTGDAHSLLSAVDGYLACQLPDSANQLCAGLVVTATTPPAVLMALARLQPQAARDLLTQALARTRDDSGIELLLAHARQTLPAAELIPWLQEVQDKTPSRAASLALAQSWEDVGQNAKATELLRGLAAAAQGADRAGLLARLAAAEQAGGNMSGAEEALREALAITPNQPALLNNAAHLALLVGGREAEAVRVARQAVAASTDDRDLQACSLATMAEALFALRLYDQARDALLKALAIHDTPEDRLLLGQTLLASGRTEQGLAQLRRAKELAEREGKGKLATQIAALL